MTTQEMGKGGQGSAAKREWRRGGQKGKVSHVLRILHAVNSYSTAAACKDQCGPAITALRSL